jgi:hypothetical protein
MSEAHQLSVSCFMRAVIRDAALHGACKGPLAATSDAIDQVRTVLLAMRTIVDNVQPQGLDLWESPVIV